MPQPPEDPGPAALYLASPDGQRVARVMEALEPLLADEVRVGDCQDAVAALDEIGTPDQVFASAAAIPDPATADMAVNYVTTSSRFLGGCLEDESPPDRDQLRFTKVVLERRLEELG